MNWPKYYLVQGAGGYSTNVYTGRFRPEDHPFTPLYTIFSRKRHPFRIPSLQKKNFASLLNAENALSCKKVPLPEKGTPTGRSFPCIGHQREYPRGA